MASSGWPGVRSAQQSGNQVSWIGGGSSTASINSLACRRGGSGSSRSCPAHFAFGFAGAILRLLLSDIQPYFLCCYALLLGEPILAGQRNPRYWYIKRYPLPQVVG